MTRLSREADRAFDDYIQGVEAKFDWQPHAVLNNPGAQEEHGVTTVPGAMPPTVDLKGAIIHDWLGAVLAPGATVKAVLAVLQSYDDYPRLYAPQITASKVLSHQGNFWRVFL